MSVSAKGLQFLSFHSVKACVYKRHRKTQHESGLSAYQQVFAIFLSFNPMWLDPLLVLGSSNFQNVSVFIQLIRTLVLSHQFGIKVKRTLLSAFLDMLFKLASYNKFVWKLCTFNTCPGTFVLHECIVQYKLFRIPGSGSMMLDFLVWYRMSQKKKKKRV